MRRASLVCPLAGLWPAATDDAALAKVAGWLRAGAEIAALGIRSTASSSRPPKKHGLPPTGPADPRTLLRRVTIDLTGVPPSAEEMRAFLVDRLLASPRYGKRWGHHWMDIRAIPIGTAIANRATCAIAATIIDMASTCG